ncbi:MAG TPA: phenylalanine--tRNA ligase beta subunit-related protein [Rectinemataceae bacterium]|nr:phenylalanine--tRNA ligase beta subunit-related protein [Rectinemataceae bacterium]
METILTIDGDPGLEGLRIGLVEARGLRWPATPAGGQFLAALAEAKTRGEALISPTRKAAVRAMLRYGAYKPAGRGKPSSEYLLQAALDDDFPAVNPFVNAANIVSLLSGYPISILDLEKSGPSLLLRRGKTGEDYVFNSGGQTIDLTDLLCVCQKTDEGYFPTANPVRDSMATKIFPGAQTVAAVLYAPAGPEGRDLESACGKLAAYLGESAESVEWSVVEAER